MNYRTIIQQTYGQSLQMGSLRVRQPLPTADLKQVSPFVLLHHAGPTTYPPGSLKTRLDPHPHRGFEPVTFLFSGKQHHKDSLGNEGFLNAGDVQWMTAGSGLLHSEGPSEEFAREGGVQELVQLWVNLPRSHKMTTPKYQDIKKENIPAIYEDEGKIELRLVAGTYQGLQGPAHTFTPILALMVWFEAGAHTVIDIPQAMNALLYVLEGEVSSNGVSISKYNLARFDNNAGAIELTTATKGKLLLLAGEPIHEPLVSYGPFVMNYPGEIKQAILDFDQGRMGTLEN